MLELFQLTHTAPGYCSQGGTTMLETYGGSFSVSSYDQWGSDYSLPLPPSLEASSRSVKRLFYLDARTSLTLVVFALNCVGLLSEPLKRMQDKRTDISDTVSCPSQMSFIQTFIQSPKETEHCIWPYMANVSSGAWGRITAKQFQFIWICKAVFRCSNAPEQIRTTLPWVNWCCLLLSLINMPLWGKHEIFYVAKDRCDMGSISQH